MQLAKLLPRPLGQSSSDCASILSSIIMGAHLDRNMARALGWRGVRPAGSQNPAWTLRLAGCESVFGIHFVGEEKNAESILGCFDVYIFPPADSPLLDKFPLLALQFAMSPHYGEALREFTGHDKRMHVFRYGSLAMHCPLRGNGLELILTAPARHQIIAADGIAAKDGWIVAPGAPECDVPAFRLQLRLFAAIAATAAQELAEVPRIAISRKQTPRMSYKADGEVAPWRNEQEILLTLQAAFGCCDSAGRKLQKLPARYAPPTRQNADLPVLHILTGFLGAGKTTFLRRWLDFLHGRERYTGVIQNEFGKVDLDSTLLKNDSLVEALDEGCVCCSIADALRPGMERMLAAMPARQFVLETTGVANPENILEAMSGLADIARPGLVITVADALDLQEHGFCQLNETLNEPQNEAGVRGAQLRKADVIILNKSDLVSPANLDLLKNSIAAVNSKALLLTAVNGEIPFAELDAWIDHFEDSRLPSQRPTLAPMGARNVTHTHEGFETSSLYFKSPVAEQELRAIIALAGPGLVRAKGIISITGIGPCIVQYAAGRLAIEETDEQPTGLAFIGADIKANLQKYSQTAQGARQ